MANDAPSSHKIHHSTRRAALHDCLILFILYIHVSRLRCAILSDEKPIHKRVVLNLESRFGYAHRVNHWKPKLVLAAGLALCAAGFVMLDRGWLVELWPPVGPIEQTFAAATGAVGLVLCVAGRFLYARRSAARDDGGDGPRADESPIEDSN